jgi:ketosteroid isomerase-like protein
MSQRNVEVVLGCVAAINARRVPEEFLAPDFRMENVSTAVTEKTYEGAEGFGQWISDFFDVLDEGAQHEAEPIAVGEGYVVAKTRLVGRGSGSGAPFDLRWYSVIWIRGEKVARVVGYASRREALEAVGLSE